MTMHPVLVDGYCSPLLRDNMQCSLRVTRCIVSSCLPSKRPVQTESLLFPTVKINVGTGALLVVAPTLCNSICTIVKQVGKLKTISQ